MTQKDFFARTEDRLADGVRRGAHLPWPARARLRWQLLTRHSRALVILFAGLVIAGPAVAATVEISANSGTVVTRSSPYARQIGTGEELNIGAQNAVAVGMGDTSGIPFAPGYAVWHRDEVELELAGPSGQGAVGSVQVTVGALRGVVANAATCSWVTYWIASVTKGDPTAARKAATEIERAPSWMSTAVTGQDWPDGLAPTIDAVKAGDAKLVRAMIDVGGLIGNGDCTALGLGAVTPAGMSREQAKARLAATRQIGMKLLLSDPAAVRINAQVMHSAEMGAALGEQLQSLDPSLAATLARQAPAGHEPLATRIGERLVAEHPARAAARARDQATSSSGFGPVRIGAQLLGLSTANLPDTHAALLGAGKPFRVALAIGNTVTLVDPLAWVLNYEGIAY